VEQFDRITMDPEIMGGKPCIRGMRVTVGMIVEALATGRTIEQLLADFPYIRRARHPRSSDLRRAPDSRTRDPARELMRILIDMNLTRVGLTSSGMRTTQRSIGRRSAPIPPRTAKSASTPASMPSCF
jgi:hypothetical protein